MSGDPSVTVYMDLYSGHNSYAYIVNVKFPDQRVDLSLETIQDLRAIVSLNAEDAAHEILLEAYAEKYCQ